jgi:PAS domain-containing protein
VLSQGAPPALQAVELLFALLNGWLLVQGTVLLLRRRPPLAVHVAFVVVGVWSVVAVWRDTPVLWRVTPAFVLLGLAMIGTGVVLARSKVAGRFGRLAGLVLVAWGVHRLDYPLLREVAWFAPIGFSLATLLEQLTAVCFVLLHVERSRVRLRTSEERYRGLVEDAPVGIFRASLDGRLLDASPTFLRLLGARAIEDVTNEAMRPRHRGRC